MDLNQVLITSLVVEADHKTWDAESKVKGSSGSTKISWTLIPLPEEASWSVEQAKAITILARRELQRLLILDAKARSAQLPDSGVESLDGYKEVLGLMRLPTAEGSGR